MVREPWHLELINSSPDGRYLAELTPSGKLALVEIKSGRKREFGVLPLGRAKWDPWSRYVLALCRDNGFYWFAGSDLVVVDAFTGELLKMPSLTAEPRYHDYEWTLP